MLAGERTLTNTRFLEIAMITATFSAWRDSQGGYVDDDNVTHHSHEKPFKAFSPQRPYKK